MLAVDAKAVGDLDGQFARGAKHQAAWGRGRMFVPRDRQMMQDRQRKGGRLSGSGLSGTKYVPAA